MTKTKYTLSIALLLLLMAANVCHGSVDIPLRAVADILLGSNSAPETWRFIVLETRLPQALTAMLCGASLAVAGLLLQTAFRNPLAGPSIFGITNGAGLGVAVVMLLLGGSVGIGSYTIGGYVAVLAAAFVGALAVTALIFFFSSVVRHNVMLLIIGIMVGYLSSSLISLLNFAATEEGVRSYMVWGMGNFGGVSMEQMPLFASLCAVGLLCSVLLVKPLNALLLGERYAENLGFNIVRVRNCLLLVVGLLSAVTTAFCGPVAFIGLAVPHIARLVLGTDNHLSLLPFTMLVGAVVALVCNFACYLPGGGGVVPLNAVTPLVGAPVIIYIIIRRR